MKAGTHNHWENITYTVPSSEKKNKNKTIKSNKHSWGYQLFNFYQFLFNVLLYWTEMQVEYLYDVFGENPLVWHPLTPHSPQLTSVYCFIQSFIVLFIFYLSIPVPFLSITHHVSFPYSPFLLLSLPSSFLSIYLPLHFLFSTSFFPSLHFLPHSCLSLCFPNLPQSSLTWTLPLSSLPLIPPSSSSIPFSIF